MLVSQTLKDLSGGLTQFIFSAIVIFSESKIDHGNDYEEQYIKARASTNRTSVFQI